MDLGLLAGSGWAAGLNVYAVVLVLGLVGRFADAAEVPPELTSTPVLVGAAILYLVEFVADKVPYLDNVWDLVHTAIRPVLAGAIGYLVAGDTGIPQAVGAGTAGVLALASHSVKASARAAVNVSPEPFSNIGLSLLEDGLVAAVVALALAFPLVALVVVVILLGVGTWVLIRSWRAAARLWRRVAVRLGSVDG